jgi:hypothetical protein
MDPQANLERGEMSEPGDVMLYVLTLSHFFPSTFQSSFFLFPRLFALLLRLLISLHFLLFPPLCPPPFPSLLPTNSLTPHLHTQCCEGMPIARSPATCENAVCRHRRCGVCYDLDNSWKVIGHCDGSEVKDEEWLLWWARHFRGSGRDAGL